MIQRWISSISAWLRCDRCENYICVLTQHGVGCITRSNEKIKKWLSHLFIKWVDVRFWQGCLRQDWREWPYFGGIWIFHMALDQWEWRKPVTWHSTNQWMPRHWVRLPRKKRHCQNLKFYWSLPSYKDTRPLSCGVNTCIVMRCIKVKWMRRIKNKNGLVRKSTRVR